MSADRGYGEREHIKTVSISRYARRLERQNLKTFGNSLTAVGIARGAQPFIVEDRPDEGITVILKGWREAMKWQAAPVEWQISHPKPTPDIPITKTETPK